MDECTSGLLGLDAFARGKYDLVVMDWEIGDMRGDEFIRRVRAGHPGTLPPMVVISGSTAAKSAATQLGVKEFIPKPPIPRALREAARRALGRGKSRGI